jgi:hypothetical protein
VSSSTKNDTSHARPLLCGEHSGATKVRVSTCRRNLALFYGSRIKSAGVKARRIYAPGSCEKEQVHVVAVNNDRRTKTFVSLVIIIIIIIIIVVVAIS